MHEKEARAAMLVKEEVQLTNDTYSVAFRCFNWKIMEENRLKPYDVQLAF